MTATRFKYANNGRTVVYVLGETWTYQGASCPSNYAISYAKEFRYDSARGRYLNRSLNTAELLAGNYVPTSSTWSDYNGEDVNSDFTVSGSTATTTTQYEPGTWDTEGGSARYLHADHLGTLRLTTSSSGSSGTLRVFTAFGELKSGPADRYGYVGDEGYQANAEIPFLHVGARYYDASSGRFLQRDPIGIEGGLDVYEYVQDIPTFYVDPGGDSWWPNKGWIRYGPSKFPVNARRSVTRVAFRIGAKHFPRLGSAGLFVLSCAVAAGVGAGVGVGINYGVPALVGGKDRLTDYPVDWIFRLITGQCPGCY